LKNFRIKKKKTNKDQLFEKKKKKIRFKEPLVLGYFKNFEEPLGFMKELRKTRQLFFIYGYLTFFGEKNLRTAVIYNN